MGQSQLQRELGVHMQTDRGPGALGTGMNPDG